MNGQPRERTTIDIFLLILFVLAVIGLVIDLVQGHWPQIASTFLLSLGLWSVMQWRRYRSRRWRTAAWICFVLAFSALLLRLGAWYGWFAG